MRISDWSSDVCSSDLLHEQQQCCGCKNPKSERWGETFCCFVHAVMRSGIIAFVSAIIITRVTIARAGLRNHVDLRQAGAQHTGAYFVQLTKRQFRCLSRSPSPPNQQHDTVGLSRNDAAVIDGQNRRGIEHHEKSEHTYELQYLMRISYDVFCVKKKKQSQT